MPCTHTGTIEGDRIEGLQEALDMRERMLCALCEQINIEEGPDVLERLLENAGSRAPGLEKKTIKKWWKKHRKAEGR